MSADKKPLIRPVRPGSIEKEPGPVYRKSIIPSEMAKLVDHAARRFEASLPYMEKPIPAEHMSRGKEPLTRPVGNGIVREPGPVYRKSIVPAEIAEIEDRAARRVEASMATNFTHVEKHEEKKKNNKKSSGRE